MEEIYIGNATKNKNSQKPLVSESFRLLFNN